MIATYWFLIVGVLLVVVALASTFLKRAPLSTSILYLAVGLGLGPHGLGLLHVGPRTHADLLERLTEVAVLVSLFTAGLKMAVPLGDRRWMPPLRLALVSMVLTIFAVALVGTSLLGLSPGAAIVLGAVLAPTDPVLASDVQISHAGDRDRLRFALTGEAGLNDGTAFPFVMLGLGLEGIVPLGPFGLRWLLVDVVWATFAGIAVGALLGSFVGRLVVHLRSVHKMAVGFDELLTLGIIALAYGVALLVHGWGFLAVFATGISLRRTERRLSGDAAPLSAHPVLTAGSNVHEIATAPEKAPAYMVHALLGFNEQLERVAEVTLVLLVGGTLAFERLPREALWFVPLLFFVVRPVAVFVGMVGTEMSTAQRALIGWFGVRGIGSLYYVTFALAHGLSDEAADTILPLTLATVASSIVLHGTSVTPLMDRYRRWRRPLRDAPQA